MQRVCKLLTQIWRSEWLLCESEMVSSAPAPNPSGISTSSILVPHSFWQLYPVLYGILAQALTILWRVCTYNSSNTIIVVFRIRMLEGATDAFPTTKKRNPNRRRLSIFRRKPAASW